MSLWTGAVNNDWNNAGNWTAGVPSPTEDAIFDASSSLPCTTGASPRSCRNLITTGYTGVLTIGTTSTANLAVSGTTITFGTSTNHLDPTNSQGLISIQTNGTIITSVSPTVIVPGFTNSGFTQTFNLVGTISIKRFVPAGGATFTSATAGTFIDIVTGGSVQGSGGVGTNVTLRINGSCTVNAAGFVTKGTVVLNTSSTLTMNGTLNFSTSISTFDCSAGTLVPNSQLFSINVGMSINLGTNSFYDVAYNGFSIVLTLLSNINITRNLTVTGNPRISGAFDITVGGNLTSTSGSLNAVTTGRKLILTGTGSGGTVTVTNFNFGPVSGTDTYTLEINCGSNNVIFTGLSTTQGPQTGSAIVNYLAGNSGTLTTTSHTFSYGGAALTINMNGSTKPWGVIRNSGGVSSSITLLSNVFCQKLGDNSQSIGTTSGDIFRSIGGPYYLGILGNAEKINLISSTSTAELRFVGSTPATFTTANPANTMAIDIRTDKTGGATVTFPAVFNWGAANKILNLNSNANFATNSTTLTLVGTPLTILNASDSQFYNLTTAANQTINLN